MDHSHNFVARRVRYSLGHRTRCITRKQRHILRLHMAKASAFSRRTTISGHRTAFVPSDLEKGPNGLFGYPTITLTQSASLPGGVHDACVHRYKCRFGSCDCFVKANWDATNRSDSDISKTTRIYGRGVFHSRGRSISNGQHRQ